MLRLPPSGDIPAPPHLSRSQPVMAPLPEASPWRWIAVWQAAGLIEGADDQTLMASFSFDARRWSQPLDMSDLREHGCLWSPVLHRTRQRVWLFYSESVSCKRPANKGRGIPTRWSPGGTIKYVQSEDGVAWSKPAAVLEQSRDGGVPKVIANQLLAVGAVDAMGPARGRWVLPYWQEPPKIDSAARGCAESASGFSAALLSGDHGRTWRRSAPVSIREGFGPTELLEGAVALAGNGTLLQVFRSQEGELYRSSSADGGSTWSPAEPLGLPNPNSKANLINLQGGDGTKPLLALAYNHNSTQGVRNNLRLAVSRDGGTTWNLVAELEGMAEDDIMMHYPTMTQEGCRLFITYSAFYRLLPPCAPTNPTCPPTPPRSQTGIRIAEVDLQRLDLRDTTRMVLSHYTAD
uniref:Bnr asp-box repeat protein n=1 Tax=Tetraselmis sp. GSL018 TaxID=582737 RepID=A0A061SJ06_9CHLO